MAATFWRIVLAFESALALLAALAITNATGWSRWWALPLAMGLLLVLQYLVVFTSIVLSRALAGPQRLSRRGLPAMWAAVREPVHFGMAQLSMMVARQPRTPDAQQSAAESTRPVLLVHGLACNRGVWRWLLPRLSAAGFNSVHAVDLPFKSDIDRHSAMLEREVLRINEAYGGSRVTIIAHSMGGLTARALLRSLGPANLRHIITVATPHNGTAIARILARILAWPSASQLCVGSKWLCALNAPQREVPKVPFTSIFSLDDNLVRPCDSARLEGATLRVLSGLGHFGLLVSPRGLDEVMSALAEAA